MNKSHFTLAFIGHVDSGKSTTLGNLIYKLGGIDKRTMDRYEKESMDLGKGSFKYAFILDRFKAERERGITIKSTIWGFETINYRITSFDLPGHRDFIKNMITGASQADVAVLIIDASCGAYEAGISKQGQTREHTLIAKTLGINQLIVCVNKMDSNSVNCSQDRYNEIKLEVSNIIKKIGYNPKNVPFIPISGWFGDNIIDKSPNMPWWKGSTLLQTIDNIEPPVRAVNKPLRLPIHDIYRIKGIGTVAVGTIATGILSPGMPVVFAPSGYPTEVLSIEMHYQPVQEAGPGDTIGINVKGTRDYDIKHGDVVGLLNYSPPIKIAKFTAKIRIINHPNKISVGYTPITYCHTSQVACKWISFVETLDKKTGKVIEKNPRYLKTGDYAIVEMEPQQPMCVEKYSEYSKLGRIIARDLHQIIAIGIITETSNTLIGGRMTKSVRN